MLTFFFDIKGILHKVLVLAGQTVNSAYYCDILQQLCENVLRLHPELWLQKNWLLHLNNALTLPPSPGNFLPKTILVSFTNHPTLLCFSN
jgi:hypothetical protein